MGFLNKMIEKRMAVAGEEEIEAMKKAGFKPAAKILEKKAAEAEAMERLRAESARSLQLDKLTQYVSTPRSIDTEFFKETAGKAPMLGKDKWANKMANTKIVCGAVVQANSDLYLPKDGTYLPMVVVFTTDSTKAMDIEWLNQIAEMIRVIKESADVPQDCKKLINALRADEGRFCFKVGASLAGLNDVWCATYTIDKQTLLPNRCIPQEKVIPFLLEEAPKEGYTPRLLMIPSKYYI